MSEVLDRDFVENIVNEINSANDNQVPVILCKLYDKLKNIRPGSSAYTQLVQNIWNFNLVTLILNSLRKDFTFIYNQWNTAEKLAMLAIDLTLRDDMFSNRAVDEENTKSSISNEIKVPAVAKNNSFDQFQVQSIDNLLIMCRRIENKFVNVPDSVNLLEIFKRIIFKINECIRVNVKLSILILSSSWFLQVFISDDSRMSLEIIRFLYNILLADRVILKKLPNLVSFTENIVNELIFILSLSESDELAEAALNILVFIINDYSELAREWPKKYYGLQLILVRWLGHGSDKFQINLKDFSQRLESIARQSASNSSNVENERAAVMIQSVWRAFKTRNQLKHINKSLAKFQQIYRKRVEERTRDELENKSKRQLVENLERDRRRKLLLKREKELLFLNSLPAQLACDHMEMMFHKSASKIQAAWRGYVTRKRMGLLKHVDRLRHSELTYQRSWQNLKTQRAAIKIQRWYRKKCFYKQLRSDNTLRKIAESNLKPQGLTESRRQHWLDQHELWKTRNAHKEYKNQEEKNQILQHAQIMVHKQLFGLRKERRSQIDRNTNLARIETDSLLLSKMPPLSSCSYSDIERFSAGSFSIASFARLEHDRCVKNLQEPWWRRLFNSDEDANLCYDSAYSNATSYPSGDCENTPEIELLNKKLYPLIRNDDILL